MEASACLRLLTQSWRGGAVSKHKLGLLTSPRRHKVGMTSKIFSNFLISPDISAAREGQQQRASGRDLDAVMPEGEIRGHRAGCSTAVSPPSLHQHRALQVSPAQYSSPTYPCIPLPSPHSHYYFLHLRYLRFLTANIHPS